uniref:Caenorhabditis elegans ly-6-related family-containing protein n=1 Tax=Elaeophora elaphi TaxID=1147741 RepID=A0A0R3RW00_9BILA
MISYFTPIFLPHNLSVFIPILLYYFQSGIVIVEAIRCYSCANDFIVWHWRHFFLKRNYGITASDQSCAKSDYSPEVAQFCPSTCFIMYLNGTNRQNGMVTVLGTVRGCSSQFLTSDQHSQLGLGPHSRVSQIGNYLSSEFDMYDITEHWCFCATDQCNEKSCYNGKLYSEFTSKRRQYLFDKYFSTDASDQATSNLYFIIYLLLIIIM